MLCILCSSSWIHTNWRPLICLRIARKQANKRVEVILTFLRLFVSVYFFENEKKNNSKQLGFLVNFAISKNYKTKHTKSEYY